YQLQTFHPSFIQLSDRYRIPILPVLCLGSEFLHPWAWNVKLLTKGVKLPFFPVSPLMIVFVLFPSMGVWAMRTRLRYYIQPCEQRSIEVKSGSTGRSHVYQAAQRLRDKLQYYIDQQTTQQGF
ncbi:MAG: glycerol acyltransferase, partial [Coleofasciculus sp. C2-GNP5-27]